jgi:hypothetical protein
MLQDEFPRLLVIDSLLHNQQHDELEYLTEDQARHGLISLHSLNAARCLRAPATVLYLASLCAENLEEPSTAQRWLTVYQSIGQRQPTEGFEAACGKSPLAVVAKVAMGVLSVDMMHLEKFSTRNMADWHEAVECAADFQQYEALHAMVKALVQRKIDTLAWLNFTRVLFSRQDSARQCTQMESLGKSYLAICNSLSGQVPSVARIRSTLALYACRALALAGCHEQVLATAKQATWQEDAYFSAFESARALCRMKRMPESIEQLDKLVVVMSQHHRNKGFPLEKSVSTADAPPAFDVEQASAALIDLQNLLQSMGQQAFLVSGTLLGFAREGKLLAHDKDIDVGIVGWEDQFDVAQALFESGRFNINLDKLQGARSYHIPIKHLASGVHIDIFIYHPEDGKWVTGVESDFGYLQKFSFTPFGVKTVKFLGIDYFVPDDAEKNLEENFGNWRHSDPCYISHLESPSTVDVGGLEYQIVARLRALEAMAAGNGDKISRVISLMERLSAHAHSMKGLPLKALKSYLVVLDEQKVAHAA